MDLSLLSWNVIGIRNIVAKGSLNYLLKKKKVKVPCIQETKCSSWDDSLKNSVWDLNSHDWVFQNSKGLSGGLATSWDNTSFCCTGISQCSNWILVQLKCISGGDLFNIVNIYAPQRPKSKILLLKQLNLIWVSAANQPVSLVRDFNCIRTAEECANCKYRRRDSESFNAFINSCNLFDVKIFGAAYTWFGPLNKKSRLDRVLLNLIWMDKRE